MNNSNAANELVNKIKTELNFNVNVINDTSKPDGAPIKVLGNKKFSDHFAGFSFTNYSEGIKNTINYMFF